MGDSVQNHGHEDNGHSGDKTLAHFHIDGANVYLLAQASATDQASNYHHCEGHDNGLVGPHPQTWHCQRYLYLQQRLNYYSPVGPGSPLT